MHYMTVNGLHIHVQGPAISGENHYNMKSFHSTILQRIVGPNCILWNYEFGWTRNLHDWANHILLSHDVLFMFNFKVLPQSLHFKKYISTISVYYIVLLVWVKYQRGPH